MAYTKTNWQDNVTPLSAQNMNKIEQGIADAHTSIDNHIARTDNPHNTTAAQTGALVSVDGVSNPGGNVDLVAGANIAITPNNTNKTVTIAGTGTWPNADMVDGIHFRINNGMLEYNDGSGWRPVGDRPIKTAQRIDPGGAVPIGTPTIIASVNGSGYWLASTIVFSLSSFFGSVLGEVLINGVVVHSTYFESSGVTGTGDSAFQMNISNMGGSNAPWSRIRYTQSLQLRLTVNSTGGSISYNPSHSNWTGLLYAPEI